ncbi:hypothetical protein EJB05_12388, partial [Eragrostis curvula]
MKAALRAVFCMTPLLSASITGTDAGVDEDQPRRCTRCPAGMSLFSLSLVSNEGVAGSSIDLAHALVAGRAAMHSFKDVIKIIYQWQTIPSLFRSRASTTGSFSAAFPMTVMSHRTAKPSSRKKPGDCSSCSLVMNCGNPPVIVFLLKMNVLLLECAGHSAPHAPGWRTRENLTSTWMSPATTAPASSSTRYSEMKPPCR